MDAIGWNSLKNMIQIRMAISVTSTILLIQIWFRFDYYYFSIRYYSINKDEALAAAKALQFDADIGIIQVVLEGDSQVLMRALIDTESLWFVDWRCETLF